MLLFEERFLASICYIHTQDFKKIVKTIVVTFLSGMKSSLAAGHGMGSRHNFYLQQYLDFTAAVTSKTFVLLYNILALVER